MFRAISFDNDDYDYLWTETKTVPDKVPRVPRNKLNIKFPAGVHVRANDTFTTGLVSFSEEENR